MFRFSIAFILIIILLGGGTVAYHFIEGWSWADSLYMTVITITTVGFGEVRPLSAEGKNITIVLIILSITTVGFFVSILISYFFEGQIFHARIETLSIPIIWEFLDCFYIDRACLIW